MGSLALLSTDGKLYYATAATSAGEMRVAEQGNPFAVSNPGSTNAYVNARERASFGIIATTAIQTIGGGVANDTQLWGISLSTALTGALSISGFGSASGSTAMTWSLPAGAAKGFYPYQWAPNNAGALTLTLGSTADIGIVGVHWRPA